LGWFYIEKFGGWAIFLDIDKLKFLDYENYKNGLWPYTSPAQIGTIVGGGGPWSDSVPILPDLEPPIPFGGHAGNFD